jgi:uncharacterized protein YjbI with pentapeptide repeats
VKKGSGYDMQEIMEININRDNFTEFNLNNSNFKRVNLIGVDFEGAGLEGAKLIEARYLTFKQLHKVKTLRNAKLGKELRNSLIKEHIHLFKR